MYNMLCYIMYITCLCYGPYVVHQLLENYAKAYTREKHLGKERNLAPTSLLQATGSAITSNG
jgi:hypothetical protein